jgi:hypothetical protein
MDPVEESDPFLEQMFARMSPGSRYLFSTYQLHEIKKAFSARTMGAHTVDFRHTVKFFRWSYYVIFLVGRERRARPRNSVTRRLLTAPRLSLAVILAAIYGYLLFAAL